MSSACSSPVSTTLSSSSSPPPSRRQSNSSSTNLLFPKPSAPRPILLHSTAKHIHRHHHHRSRATRRLYFQPPSPLALSFLPPTRPSAHPLLLTNPHPSHHHHHQAFDNDPADLSPPPLPLIAPHAESGETAAAEDAAAGLHSPAPVIVRIDAFVHVATVVGGLFIAARDAQKLALAPAGQADTVYGPVQRYSQVQALFFGRATTIHNVYELPPAFERHPQYAQGIVGADTLRSLGFTVAVDNCGMVRLKDPESSEYYAESSDNEDEEFGGDEEEEE